MAAKTDASKKRTSSRTGTRSAAKKKTPAAQQVHHNRRSADDENILSMLAHLLGLFTGFIGPLVLFLIKKDEKGGKVYKNAAHALNFQLSLIIYSIISGLLVLVIIGIPLVIALGIFALVVQIIAAIRAYEGGVYHYPLEISFFH